MQPTKMIAENPRKVPLRNLRYLSVWRYLFAGNTGWRNVWCRFRGHPEGPVWFTTTALEPDMRCRTCDEYIG